MTNYHFSPRKKRVLVLFIIGIILVFAAAYCVLIKLGAKPTLEYSKKTVRATSLPGHKGLRETFLFI